MHPFVGDAIAVRRRCSACAATPMPASAIPPSRRWSSSRPGCGRWSCSTARRSPSRTWRCSCSAGCSTMCSREHGRAHHHRRRHLRRHRLGRDRGLPRPAAASTSSSCIPHGRTSEVQRRQMTTVRRAQRRQHRRRRHVRRLPGPGEGDVRRRAVPPRPAAFGGELHQLGPRRRADPLLRRRRAGARRPDREVAFSVPTGNFGNVLAAWAARRMGVPIARLIVASNRNDILTRFLDANDMSVRGVEPSLSPSMDIQVSSNFERLLFELLDRDPAATAATMQSLPRHRPHGGAGRRLAPGAHAVPRLPARRRRHARRKSARLDAPGLPGRPAHRHRHRRRPRPSGARTSPCIAAATAHPAKFPDAMERPPAAAPLCRRTSPTYMTGPNTSRARPTTSAPSRPRSAPSL